VILEKTDYKLQIIMYLVPREVSPQAKDHFPQLIEPEQLAIEAVAL
jgi:hypothetical protein